MKRTNSPQDTLIILAAGAGSRMGAYTDLVPKHLLPYQNKAILSHIIDQYPKSTKVLIVVGSDDDLTEDYLSYAHQGLDVRVLVSENPKPGNPLYDLKHALENVVLNSHVFVTVADGIYTLPQFTDEKNWLGTKEVSVTEQYSYTNLLSMPRNTAMILRHATEKKPVPQSLAWTGLMYVTSPRWLLQAVEVALENPDAPFSAVFNVFKDYVTISLIDTPNWIDFGTEEKYREHLPRYDWSKPDQITYFVRDSVIKFFGVMSNAYNFAARPVKTFTLPSRFPKVSSSGHYISYPFIEGQPAYKGMSGEQFVNFLDVMYFNFWTVKGAELCSDSDINRMRVWAIHKATDRLIKYSRTSQTCEDEYHHINGVPITDTWEKVLWNIQAAETDIKPGIIHGDLTLDNLIITHDGVVKMLDWRPTTGYTTLGNLGDVYYDLGKLWLSLLIDLSEVKKGNLHMQGGNGHLEMALPSNSKLEYFQELFLSWCAERGFDSHTIEAQTVMQLASMSGVHHEPFSTAFYWYGLYLAHKTA